MALVVNEVPSKRTSAPRNMPTCGDFDLTVDEFKKAIMNTAKGLSNRYHIATIILVALLGTALLYWF